VEHFRTAHEAGGQRLLNNAVQWRTLARYAGDWKKWDAFMHRWMVNSSEDSLFLTDVSLRVQIATLGHFGPEGEFRHQYSVWCAPSVPG
jgi:hypothetical protein